jgi:hypothetical protein
MTRRDEMTDRYEVLQPDGTVIEHGVDQFAEVRRVRTHAEHDQLIAEGWLALDEEVEAGEMAQPTAAWKQALTETVTAPEQASDVVIYVLGRLKDGVEGTQVV